MEQILRGRVRYVASAICVVAAIALALALAGCGPAQTAAPEQAGTTGASSSQTTIVDLGQVKGGEPLTPLVIPPPPAPPADNRITIVPYDTLATPSGVPVPSVMGMSEDSAAFTLRSKGFGVTVRRGPSTTNVPAGEVYAEEPSAGSYHPRGTTVAIWISVGPPKGGAPFPGPTKP